MERMDVLKKRGRQNILCYPYSFTSCRPTDFPISAAYDDSVMQKDFKVAASNSTSPWSD